MFHLFFNSSDIVNLNIASKMQLVLLLTTLFFGTDCISNWGIEPTFYNGNNAPLPKEGANLDNLHGRLYYQNGYVPCTSFPAQPNATNVYEKTIAG